MNFGRCPRNPHHCGFTRNLISIEYGTVASADDLPNALYLNRDNGYRQRRHEVHG